MENIKSLENKKESKKGILKKLLKSKLFMTFAILGIFVMISSTIVAVIYFGYDRVITGNVVSGKGLEVDLDFEKTFLLNVTDGSMVYGDSLRLLNLDGATTMNTSLNITKGPVDSNCDYLNDCEITLKKDSLELFDGSNFSMLHWDNDFSLNVSCAKRSCEQNISIDLSFYES